MIAGALGGFLGGASHPVLDALGRRGTYPLMPWSKSNPFFGMMPYWSVMVACVVAGVLGYWILRVRRPETPAAP